MANVPIAEFNVSDGFTPQQINKLNYNFRNNRYLIDQNLAMIADTMNRISNSGGSFVGVSDYPDLSNKPSINGIVLVGDKSFSDLGMSFASSPEVGGNADKTNAILYGSVDSNSTSNAFTATVSGLTELAHGTCVLLKNDVVTSADPFTINVNGLGAKPVYSSMASVTRETTVFDVNYTCLFIYDSNRVEGGCWIFYRGYAPPDMTILSYGHSTWADFIAAYESNSIVYCRASSQSNPASGSQTRLAFMAYLNNATNPTEVEFQYYRSVSTKTATQQGDQVYVYKLNKTNGWSVIVREAKVKLAVGAGLSQSFSNNTLTISSNLDYEELNNKPSIEDVVLIDNKDFPDLGIFIEPEKLIDEDQYPASDDYALTSTEITKLWNTVMNS